MKLYSTKETAEILGVSTNTVRAMIDRGELKTYGYLRPKSLKRHRKLQIAQGTIIAYIKSCHSRFPAKTLARFNIREDEDAASIDTVQAAPAETVSENAIESAIPIETPYALEINDRIAIGHITKRTAVNLLNIIMNDPMCCIESVKICLLDSYKSK